MSQEKSEHCQFLVIEQRFSEQNVLRLGEGGEIPEKGVMAKPPHPRCYSHIVREVRGHIETISLDTLDAFCRGDFAKCQGYVPGVEDVNSRLDAIRYLVENGKTSAKVLLKNRIAGIHTYDERRPPDIYADIVLTEDADNYNIALVGFSKLDGGDIDDLDIVAGDIMSGPPMKRLCNGDPCAFQVNKKTGLVDIKYDNTSNDKRLILGLAVNPMYKVVNTIVEQMKG